MIAEAGEGVDDEVFAGGGEGEEDWGFAVPMVGTGGLNSTPIVGPVLEVCQGQLRGRRWRSGHDERSHLG